MTDVTRSERRGADSWAQSDVTDVYNRNARLYDLVEAPMELLLFRRWRPRLLAGVRGRALELGVGTGRNFSYYPPEEQATITGVDAADAMLELAERRRQRLRLDLTLQLADAQQLPFPDGSFGTVFAAFVFCSVADPVLGLREAYRVLEPGGQLRLLEHQRPPNRVLGQLFDRLNPLAVRLSGANVNRRTDANVRLTRFEGVSSEGIEPLGIVRLITAHKPEKS